jgi:hypothetical protein
MQILKKIVLVFRSLEYFLFCLIAPQCAISLGIWPGFDYAYRYIFDQTDRTVLKLVGIQKMCKFNALLQY